MVRAQAAHLLHAEQLQQRLVHPGGAQLPVAAEQHVGVHLRPGLLAPHVQFVQVPEHQHQGLAAVQQRRRAHPRQQRLHPRQRGRAVQLFQLVLQLQHGHAPAQRIAQPLPAVAGDQPTFLRVGIHVAEPPRTAVVPPTVALCFLQHDVAVHREPARHAPVLHLHPLRQTGPHPVGHVHQAALLVGVRFGDGGAPAVQQFPEPPQLAWLLLLRAALDGARMLELVHHQHEGLAVMVLQQALQGVVQPAGLATFPGVQPEGAVGQLQVLHHAAHQGALAGARHAPKPHHARPLLGLGEEVPGPHGVQHAVDGGVYAQVGAAQVGRQLRELGQAVGEGVGGGVIGHVRKLSAGFRHGVSLWKRWWAFWSDGGAQRASNHDAEKDRQALLSQDVLPDDSRRFCFVCMVRGSLTPLIMRPAMPTQHSPPSEPCSLRCTWPSWRRSRKHSPPPGPAHETCGLRTRSPQARHAASEQACP